MEVFQLVLALLIAGALLSLLADRIGVPAPSLLALAGAGLALLPRTPAITPDPELILALFVAPVLLKAGYDMSLRELRANWAPVAVLVVNLVCLTTACVAVVSHLLLPSLPWAACVALGAIVAPSDASAATSVLRRLGPPRRQLAILEGESLLNDASALLIYRVAVAAASGGMTPRAVPFYVATTLAGAVLGTALAWLLSRFRPPSRDVPNLIVLQFLIGFGVWLLADRLGVSAILAVVAFALATSRFSPGRLAAYQRRVAIEVWGVAVSVLTMLAFILTGLQLKPVLADLGNEWRFALLFAAAACAVVILVRLLSTLARTGAIGLVGRLLRRRRSDAPMRRAVFVGWSGMRGVVTLATALALPEPFPHRGLLVFAAFSVVLVTLVLQGFTLAPLLRRLRLRDDGSVRRHVALAHAETAEAALASLDPGDDSPLAASVRRHYEDRRLAADTTIRGGVPAAEMAALLSRTVAVQRTRLDALRAAARISDEAHRLVEEELDWLELSLTRQAEPE